MTASPANYYNPEGIDASQAQEQQPSQEVDAEEDVGLQCFDDILSEVAMFMDVAMVANDQYSYDAYERIHQNRSNNYNNNNSNNTNQGNNANNNHNTNNAEPGALISSTSSVASDTFPDPSPAAPNMVLTNLVSSQPPAASTLNHFIHPTPISAMARTSAPQPPPSQPPQQPRVVAAPSTSTTPRKSQTLPKPQLVPYNSPSSTATDKTVMNKLKRRLSSSESSGGDSSDTSAMPVDKRYVRPTTP
jgi:hypothetical protein